MDQAIRIAQGFGGGMRHGGTCGALTGAYMVLGMQYSAEECLLTENKEAITGMIQEFNQRFLEKHDSMICRDLLRCDVNTPEGKEFAETQGLDESICSHLIQSAMEILEDLI